MKIVTIFLVLFMLPQLGLSLNMSLHLEVEPEEVIVGIPLLLKLKLESVDDFILHGPFGVCDGQTKIIIKDDSGNQTDIIPTDCGGFQVSENALDSDAKTSYQGIALTEDEIYFPVGHFRISAEYHSTGPYLDRYSDTDIRPVEGIWVGEVQSNQVEVTVKNPEGQDQNVILGLNLSPQDASSPKKLSWFLKTKGEEILKSYPKSTYAAWVLWKLGSMRYANSSLGMDKTTIEEDFAYSEHLKRTESGEFGSNESFRDELLGIIEVWDPLYRTFPDFFYRKTVLKGLAQTYIRLGEYQKAVPTIKEFLDKYLNTSEAKKMLQYQQAMEKRGLWKSL